MRPLSLQSDLEHEIWLLMKELVDEHGMSIRDAREAVAATSIKVERDMIADAE